MSVVTNTFATAVAFADTNSPTFPASGTIPKNADGPKISGEGYKLVDTHSPFTVLSVFFTDNKV